MRLLIVSPYFPPLNTPDMQRVRMSLPYFIAAGWEVTVLAVDEPEPAVPVERELLDTVPAEVRVVRTRCARRRAGVGSIALRALPFLLREGARIIREWRPDLVFFSTTQFFALPLGRLWRSRLGVPFVVDLQDPWLTDYYNQPGAPPPPGGWKFHVVQFHSWLLEGWTLRRCAHVISVSQRYLDTLGRRYPWFRADHGSVLSFGAPETDMELARRKFKERPPLLPAGQRLRIAYAGRLGMDMRHALEVLFAGVATLRREGVELELFFFGTSYAESGLGASSTQSLAAAAGVADLVHEAPARIPYLDSLRLLLETDVALVLGSEDPAYSPSKLYPTLLAERPTMGIAPVGSVLASLLSQLGGAVIVTFMPDVEGIQLAGMQVASRLRELIRDGRSAWPPAQTDRLRREHGAKAVAELQLDIFRRVINPPALKPSQLQR
jgi:glycosyltransferase involved in cell wall biosynthesis